jgi:hypothetical protein
MIHLGFQNIKKQSTFLEVPVFLCYSLTLFYFSTRIEVLQSDQASMLYLQVVSQKPPL